MLEKKRQDRLSRPDLIANLIPGKGLEKWTGSHHTEESKEAISESLTGKIASEETRKKISESMKERNKDES